MTRTRIAWAIGIVDVVAYVIGSALDPITEPLPAVIIGMVVTSFVVVGALLFTRVPGNPIGALLLAAGSIQAFGAAVGAYADVGQVAAPPWPAWPLAAILANLTFTYPIVIALIGVPLIFPDGRFPSPRYRWIAWLAIIAMIGQTFVDLFGSATVGAANLPNPLRIPALEPILSIVGALVALTSIVGFGGAAAAVATRFRHGDRIVREQTKWLVAVAAVATIAFPTAFIVAQWAPELADVFFLIGILTMVALPVAIGIAVLRYRLFEIDRIISRTISYAGITGILALVYGGAILLLSELLSTVAQGQTVAVAASTLAVFALFQPLRRRVQRVVDRRFDRARYDGARTVAAFSERLRSETDMRTLTDDLAATATTTVAPTSLGIWLRPRSTGR